MNLCGEFDGEELILDLKIMPVLYADLKSRIE
jgi:hypothetical protein